MKFLSFIAGSVCALAVAATTVQAEDANALLICGADGSPEAYQLIGFDGGLHDVLPERHAELFSDVKDMQLTVSRQLSSSNHHSAYCFSQLVPMSVEPKGDFYESAPKMGTNQCGRDSIQGTALQTSYEVATDGKSVIRVLVAQGARRPAEKTFSCRLAQGDEKETISKAIASVFSGGKTQLGVAVP
jgi:hypothetical protein